MMNAQDYITLTKKHGAGHYRPLEVVLSRGEGVWVYDVDGHKYLDCLSAYSAVSQGHCHPRLVKAMTNQAQRITLTSGAFYNDQVGCFYKTVSDITGYPKILPMNSGAEAVETAVKVARKWGYTRKNIPLNQAEIIVCDNNFHGRTTTVISFSSENKYREKFGPHTPGFKIIPYGDIDALKSAITPHTVAFMLEPIQGEGGIVIPPKGYLQAVRQLCTAENVLMIADEIQTGLGRTGELFACDHESVQPDIMVIGKALSGGFYPVSAILSSEAIMNVLTVGDHGSTFGGNPLGAAIASEALQIIVDENLAQRAAELGDYFQARLAEIPSRHVKEVRGRGLLIGVELHEDAGGARRFCEALQARGILCKETHKHIIRFAPPLVITQADIDWILGHVSDVLAMD